MNWQPQKRTEQLYARAIFRVFQRAQSSLLSGAEFIALYAEQAALRMITALLFAGARTWREAASKAGKGAVINRALQRELSGPVGRRMRELVRANSALISSYPRNVAAQVAARAAAHQLGGGRAGALETALLGVARSRARLIARTEVSKASTALTRARAETYGMPWYVWETSQDQRVRPAHRKMSKVLVQFSDPPSPEQLAGMKPEGFYNAGDTYNCRCYPAPLVRAEEVRWPHRVYHDGRIQYMTLSAFKHLNLQLGVAA